MEQVQIKPYFIDGKYLQLSIKDNRLVVEVEDLVNGKSFFTELDNDAIVQVSNEIFSDVNAMHEGFEDALKLKNICKEVMISCDNTGLLKYKRAFFASGCLEKENQFSFSLQERKSDPIENPKESKMEDKKFAHLMNMISDLGQNVFTRISDLEKNLLTKLDKLEQRVTVLEGQKMSNERNGGLDESLKNEHMVSKESFVEKDVRFDRVCPQSKCFKITNDGKTIENVQKEMFSELPFTQCVPSNGRFKLSLKLERMSQDIWIGLIAAEHLEKQDWHSMSTYYLITDGSIRTDNRMMRRVGNQSFISPRVGDIVSMAINVDADQLVFSMNGVSNNWIPFNFKEKKYFPYLGFDAKGGKVTIV